MTKIIILLSTIFLLINNNIFAKTITINSTVQQQIDAITVKEGVLDKTPHNQKDILNEKLTNQKNILNERLASLNIYSESIDDESNWLDFWLTVVVVGLIIIGIIIAAFGIAVPYYGLDKIENVNKIEKQVIESKNKTLNAEKLANKSKTEQKKEVEKLQKQIEKNPQSIKADKLKTRTYELQALAYKLQIQGKIQDAINKWLELVYITTKNKNFSLLEETYFNLGYLYTDNKLKVQYYSNTIALNPKNAQAYNNRGTAYYKNNKLDKAITDFNKAIAFNHQHAQAYNNRGLAYEKQNKKILAEKNFAKAQELGFKA